MKTISDITHNLNTTIASNHRPRSSGGTAKTNNIRNFQQKFSIEEIVMAKDPQSNRFVAAIITAIPVPPLESYEVRIIMTKKVIRTFDIMPCPRTK